MIILLTGTPGTGKSTVTGLLSDEVQTIRLNDLIETDTDTDKDTGICVGFDERRGSRIVDIKKLSKKVREVIEVIDGDMLIEGHLSHHLPFGDITIVLRTHPRVLETRLDEKGFLEEKIRENLEAEALDVCLIESLENHEKVYEIDTTDKSPMEVKEDILKIIRGKGDKYLPGKIDWCEDFFQI